jgi:hypothetical protein
MATVAGLTLSVVLGREKTELCLVETDGCPIGRDSGGVDRRDINQHNWDVVLNGVNAAADAAFETLSVRVQDNRLLTNGADQNVE